MAKAQIEQTRSWARPFFTIWIGQALSMAGSRVGGFALVWWLTQESGRATVLAGATLVMMLPNVFLGPFAGALVDRWNRRRVMLVADTAIALFSAWLACLFWTARLQIWHVYVIMFARALGHTFHWPAMQASTSLMVPRTELARVGGMNQTLNGVLGVAMPPLGALLMGLLPLHWIMALDVATAAFAIVPLFFVSIPQPPARQQAPAQVSLFSDVREGFSYIWGWKGVVIVLVVATLINMAIHPGMSLLPILVSKGFGGEALQLAWLNSGWGFGMIAGGLALSLWGGFKRRILTGLMGLVGMGLGLGLVGLAPVSALWVALTGMAIAGFMNPICNGPFFAILQDVVEPEMQGRVFTVVTSLSGAAAPIGMAIAGPVADRFGVQAWFVAGGLLCATMGLGLFFVPAVMNLEHGRTQAPEAVAAPARAD